MSKKAFAFLALLLALCVAGSLLLGKYGFGAGDYARFIFGADNRAVLASSAMIGTIFLIFCDSFSRLIFTFEIPIGIVSSPRSSPTCRRRTRRPMTTASLTSR